MCNLNLKIGPQTSPYTQHTSQKMTYLYGSELCSCSVRLCTFMPWVTCVAASDFVQLNFRKQFPRALVTNPLTPKVNLGNIRMGWLGVRCI